MDVCAIKNSCNIKQSTHFQLLFRQLLIFAIVTVAWAGIGSANNNEIPIAQLIENKTPDTTDKDNIKGQNPVEKSVEQKQPEKEITVVKSKEKSEEVKYPEIRRDLSSLPFPVRRMRELILEATLSGDIEKLRPLIGYGVDVTMLSLGGIEEDPLNFLKSLAGDENGHEILAILAEVLESGYVLMDEGTDEELYVWPYFFAWPLDKLTPPQKVELYRLVTYGDYEDMESFGAYIFYRLGITPRGRWRFFVAGD